MRRLFGHKEAACALLIGFLVLGWLIHPAIFLAFCIFALMYVVAA
jgi:hypothetical protein